MQIDNEKGKRENSVSSKVRYDERNRKFRKKQTKQTLVGRAIASNRKQWQNFRNLFEGKLGLIIQLWELRRNLRKSTHRRMGHSIVRLLVRLHYSPICLLPAYHSPVHLLLPSIASLQSPLNHTLAHSATLTHSLTRSLTRSFAHSLARTKAHGILSVT